MIIDGTSIPSGTTLRASVCVVGAGPAGIAVARTLAASGLDVIVIESGGVQPMPEAQQLNRGLSIGYPYAPLVETRARGFGGSALAWDLEMPGGRGAQYRPLEPFDLELRHWVPNSGWPISHEEIQRELAQAAEWCGLDAAEFRPREAQGFTEALEPPDFEAVLFRAGLATAHTKEPLEELARSTRITLVTARSAIELLTDQLGQQVVAIRAAGLDGRSMRVEAGIYVLAAGAIENARLLLVSAQGERAGIGNGHDLVGRFFMEHLHVWTGVVQHGHISANESHPETSIGEEGVGLVRRKYALSPRTQERHGVLSAVMMLRTRPWESSLAFLAHHGPTPEAIEMITRDRPNVWKLRWARSLLKERSAVPIWLWRHLQWRLAQQALPKDQQGSSCVVMYVHAEQQPNPDSRVVLSDEVDALGLRLMDPVCRRADLNWRLTEMDFSTLRTIQKLATNQLQSKGYGRVTGRLRADGEIAGIGGGSHHMGTTRMSASPRSGVVDIDGKVHGVGNLYVAGSSVFPTVGYANPTLTIVALAIRLGKHLVNALKDSGYQVRPG